MHREIIIHEVLPLDSLERVVSTKEWESSQRFTSQHRRCEWLSWRHILQSHIGSPCEIAYADNGAPYIVGSQLFISVSHSSSHVAIIIDHHRCAIDIEHTSRNFSRVASRYISPKEEEILDCSTHPLALAIAWCAKEAAYKYAMQRELDFIRDIEITSIDYLAKTLQIQIKDRVSIAHFDEIGAHVIVTI